MADGFFNSSEIDDALTHHRRSHLLEFPVIVTLCIRDVGFSRCCEAHQLLIETILYAQQRRGDVKNDLIICNTTTLDHVFKSVDLAFNIAT